jgi:predicted dithiol-disulfide oxidoreductase (DUF899 family)
MVRFDKDKYMFEMYDGPRRVLDLFGAHDQSIVSQFMDRGFDEYCPGLHAFH